MLLQNCEVLAQGAPAALEPHGSKFLVQFRQCRAKHGTGRLRLADDLGCDSLADFALRLGVRQKRKIGMAVQINESGGNDESVRFDDALGCDCAEPAHRRNLAVFDRHVALIPGAASPIHDVGMNNDNVVQRLSGCLGSSCVESKTCQEQSSNDMPSPSVHRSMQRPAS